VIGAGVTELATDGAGPFAACALADDAGRTAESAISAGMESRMGIESTTSVVSVAAAAADAVTLVCSTRREIAYPTPIIAAMTRPVSTSPRVNRTPAGADDIAQFGQTPMATGRCTPHVGQLTVGTRSPAMSYETNGAWQRGQRVAPTSALAPHAAQLV
jgi:hypothetical protein